MKATVAFLLLTLLTAVARADWNDVKPGMDGHAVWATAGTPMMVNKARGSEIWTYDRGGYILFQNGRVLSWEQPKPEAATKVAIAHAAPKQQKPASLSGPLVALKD